MATLIGTIQALKLSNPAQALEKEANFIKQIMKSPHKCTYLVDMNWAINYTSYLDGSSHQVGPINNFRLLHECMDNIIIDSLEDDRLLKGIRILKDFVLLNQQTWMFIKQLYGGGPEIYYDPHKVHKRLPRVEF